MVDIGASVLARLKQKANENNIQFQQMLTLFCQEEFLRRISKSQYSEHIILKGGLLIYSMSGFTFRPTIDADYLLKNCSNDLKNIKGITHDILNVYLKNKFIKYEVKDFEKIAEQRRYNGIRANLIGKIKNTRTHISIDFGIGDIVVPAPKKRLLPIILPDFEQPYIFTYSLESIIAEKLDAIITRMETTSRMKDFYDIYYLAKHFSFDGRKLQEAIFRTLANRGTPYEANSIQIIMRLRNDNIIIRRWINFCKKILKYDLDFNNVLNLIIKFLSPPFEAVVKENEFFGYWDSNIEYYDI